MCDIKEMEGDVLLTSFGTVERVKLQLTHYLENGLLCINAECLDGEQYGALTINLGKSFKNNMTTIKDEYYKTLLEYGVIEEEIVEIPYGWDCKAHLCKINVEKFK